MNSFGCDISAYQEGLSAELLVKQGLTFAVVKATEGSTYVNPLFYGQLSDCVAARLAVSAYHFVSTELFTAQVDRIERTVPSWCPIWLDMEGGNGAYPVLSTATHIGAALRAHGWNCPGIYLPDWYWQNLGSPTFPTEFVLWAARYGSTNHFQPMGGSVPGMLQYSETGAVDGWNGAIDLDVIRGPVPSAWFHLPVDVPRETWEDAMQIYTNGNDANAEIWKEVVRGGNTILQPVANTPRVRDDLFVLKRLPYTMIHSETIQGLGKL